MATELAKAYVQILPSAKGIKGALEKELGAEVPAAGKSAGNSFGSSFVKGVAGFGKAAAATIGAATAAAGALGKAAVTTGAAFDTSMAQVAATMGKTVGEIGKLRAFALEQGATTAFSATQAAEALNYMALAGYDSAKAMQMLPNVLDLAAAGGIELAYASDMVTDAQSALGLGMEETAQLVDKMAKTASRSNTSVAQLGEAILTVGGTAKNLAGGTTELSTALGILADNGVKGAEGGTALRNIILSLSSPTDTAAQAMEKLGLQVFDANGEMRPLNETFGDLQNALSSLTQGEQIQVLNKIFNKVDLKSVNALLANTGDRFDELSGYINNAQGAASAMSKTQLDNLAGDVTLFQSALEGAKIALSDKLTPSLRDMVQFGTQGVSALAKAFQADGLSGAMQAFGELLSQGLYMVLEKAPAMVDAGMQLLGSLCSGLLDNLPALTDAAMQIFTMLATALIEHLPQLAGAAAQMLSALAVGLMDALPQLLQYGAEILTTLADGIEQAIPQLLEQALPLVARFAENIRQNAGELVDAGIRLLLGMVDGLIAALPTLLAYLPQIIIDICGVINDNMPKLFAAGITIIGKLISGLLQAIPDILANMPKIIEAILSVISAFNWLDLGKTVMTAFADGIKAMVSFVHNAGRGIADAVKNAIVNLPATLRSLGSRAISFMSNGIRGMLSTIKNAASAVFTKIVDAVMQLPSRLWNIAKDAASSVAQAFKNMDWLALGKNIISGIISGIGSMASALWEAAKNVAKSALQAAKDFLGIKSPSKVMRDQVGRFIPEGIAVGIAQHTGAVSQAMRALADETTGTLQTRVVADVTAKGSAALQSYAGAAADGARNENVFHIHIEGARYTDERTLAQAITQEMQFMLERRSAVFGTA